MLASDALTWVTLDLDDVPGGLALSDEAGWNQTGDDWRVFIRDGHTIGYRNGAGRLVATAAALPYGRGVGWISMVLVTRDARHKGLATQLLDGCVKYLRKKSVVPVLDATPAGAPVYRRIGFEACFGLARWEGDAQAKSAFSADAAGVAAGGENQARVRPDDLQKIVELDAVANGADRGFLLADFLSRDGSCGWVARDGSGFVIVRRGRRATQLGPLVAGDETSALLLLDSALNATSGRVFLDVPERWTSVATWLEQRGFDRQRPFVRMAFGVPLPTPGNDRLFVVAGPEFG